MRIILPYQREKAVEYAKKHVFVRDNQFFDFTEFGGNCTAFVSQCLYAANGIMNPSLWTGWYFYDVLNRSPSWSGVTFFHKFLIQNSSLGPFGKSCDVSELELGDIVQLKFSGYEYFTHTLLVTKMTSSQKQTEKNIFISANTYDVLDKNLVQYNYAQARFIKILGVYDWRD